MNKPIHILLVVWQILLKVQIHEIGSVHDELEVCESSTFEPAVLYVGGPGGALDIHENARHGVLQLDHDDGAEVTALVAVGVEVAGEATEGDVGDESDILAVWIVLSITVQPHHVHLRAGSGEAARVVTRAVVLPDLLYIRLQLARHGGVVHDLVVGVGHRPPVVDLVHLQQNAGFPVPVPIGTNKC